LRLHYITQAEIAALTKQQVCGVLRRDSPGWNIAQKIEVGDGVPMKKVIPELHLGVNLGERPLTIIKRDERIHLDFFSPNYEKKRRVFEATLIVPGTLIIRGPMR
jgi:hypothetical protein